MSLSMYKDRRSSNKSKLRGSMNGSYNQSSYRYNDRTSSALNFNGTQVLGTDSSNYGTYTSSEKKQVSDRYLSEYNAYKNTSSHSYETKSSKQSEKRVYRRNMLTETKAPPPSSSSSFLPRIGSTSSSRRRRSNGMHGTKSLSQMRSHQGGSVDNRETTTSSTTSTSTNSGLVTTSQQGQFSGSFSIQGKKGANKRWINQDAYLLVEGYEGHQGVLKHVFIVLDGHGSEGHVVSRKCTQLFEEWIRRERDTKKVFRTVQAELLANQGINSTCSGATCIMVSLLPHQNKIEVANCGDSRAILGRRKGGSNDLEAIALSEDHKPDNKQEEKRIQAMGGHVGRRHVLVNQGALRGLQRVPYGPARVWYQYQGDTLGLAMSRSLGDAEAHRVGVSEEPELVYRELDEKDKYIVLASDGIWDVLPNLKVIHLVDQYFQSHRSTGSKQTKEIQAAKVVCEEARRLWEAQANVVDDITCIVLSLDTYRQSTIQEVKIKRNSKKSGLRLQESFDSSNMDEEKYGYKDDEEEEEDKEIRSYQTRDDLIPTFPSSSSSSSSHSPSTSPSTTAYRLDHSSGNSSGFRSIRGSNQASRRKKRKTKVSPKALRQRIQLEELAMEVNAELSPTSSPTSSPSSPTSFTTSHKQYKDQHKPMRRTNKLPRSLKPL